jgi:hypothetical protein
MRDLGVDAHRFSFAWPRSSRRAVARRTRMAGPSTTLIDELLAQGTQLAPTLPSASASFSLR